MKEIIIFILTICSFSINGQSNSETIKLLTNNQIKLLPKKDQKFFENILQKRIQVDWTKRIDSTKFDYVFIDETYCYADTTSIISEKYFVKSDTIPKSIFNNGQNIEPKTIYEGFGNWYSKNVIYFTTLFPLINKFSKLKPIQELQFDSKQIFSRGCIVSKNDKKNFEVKMENQLRTTYQIQTMVDKINNKIVVSIQVPPKKPRFKTIVYNNVWDW